MFLAKWEWSKKNEWAEDKQHISSINIIISIYTLAWLIFFLFSLTKLAEEEINGTTVVVFIVLTH